MLSCEDKIHEAKRHFTERIAHRVLNGPHERDEYVLGYNLLEIDKTLYEQQGLLIDERIEFAKTKLNKMTERYKRMCEIRSHVDNAIDYKTASSKSLMREIVKCSKRIDKLKSREAKMKKKKRNWDEALRDDIARVFHFETLRNEISKNSMQHFLFQLPEMTLTIMSHLFSSPIHYTQLVIQFDMMNIEHEKGLRSTIALLLTCRYMYKVFGELYYENLHSNIKDKDTCFECVSWPLDRCGRCEISFCSDCSPSSARCYSCETLACGECAAGIEYETCEGCNNIFCEMCTEIDNHGRCVHCQITSDTSEEEEEVNPEDIVVQIDWQ